MDSAKALQFLADIPELFFLLSPDLEILWGNNSLQKIFPEYEKLPCYKIIHQSEEPPKNCPALKALTTKKTSWAIMQTEALQKEFMVIVSPVIRNNEVVALWHLAIESPKGSSLTTEDLNLYFETMGQLAVGLSHDIKNMLTAALGELELLTMYVKDNPNLRRKCQKVKTILDNVAQIAQKISSISSNANSSDTAFINVNQIFQEMRPLLKALVPPEINLKIILNPYAGNIFFNKGRLEQIILNLVFNAMQAISGPGEIILSCSEEDDCVVISVEDNGRGIKKELLHKLFEPHFSTKRKGAGLGLAMVKEWVEEASGKVKISSVEGEGTKVEIWLPRIL
ncbi:sensor histidine kinase [Thermodesulfatator autotrophicus]|uniref:histidine kinase n=1 Tax=Thermodesulfatator autotrophicus TaxID=1795632 RepID=A0A177E814_9BACT|nr:HAMP domain-containing sensor histidine kinase [Thermodesulfatator autotrophicus]OAG27836.1 hypothetical protein TH606_04710 [Thermodesulfatator autotrophicus]